MKHKIQAGLLALLAVISFAGCQKNEVEQNIQNNNENNVITNEEENNVGINNNNEQEIDAESGDFPENPKDVLGNKMDFTDTLEFTAVGGTSYQVTTEGNQLIDNTTKIARTAIGIQGNVKSFICEAETESTKELLNFIVLNDAGKLFVAHLENSEKTSVSFEEVKLSEKVIGIGTAKVGYEEFEGSFLKTESGRLMKINCYYEEEKAGASLNDYIPAEEKVKYNTYMKLIGEYEFVEAQKLQTEATNASEETPVFSEGVMLTLVNPIPHGTISLSLVQLNENKEATFWWDYSVAEETAYMYFSEAYKNQEELAFTYEETPEGISLKVNDSNFEMKFKKK